MKIEVNLKSKLDLIGSHIERFKAEGKKAFISSSFQTHSIPLLHIISKLDSSIPIYFLNTGFHFPETLLFRDKVASLLNMEVIPLESTTPKINQRDQKGRFFFCSNSEYCCHLNKILPLQPVLIKHDIWINGVRRDQNSNRQRFNFIEDGPFETSRFHPMLDWNSKMIWQYRKLYNLPEHPLEKDGYFSIGCAPCTQKLAETDRGGRWVGQNKTECGLHTELANSNSVKAL